MASAGDSEPEDTPVAILGLPLWRWAGITYFVVTRSCVKLTPGQWYASLGIATQAKAWIHEQALRAVLRSRGWSVHRLNDI